MKPEAENYRQPVDEDLIALCEAVQAAKRPEPPPTNKSTAILFQLSPPLFDQLGEWRNQVTSDLGREQVTDADVSRALVQLLLLDEDLRTRVTEVLRGSM